MKNLIRVVENETENPFVVFETKRNQTIALELNQDDAAQAEIPTT